VADRIEASYKKLQEKIDHLPQAILSKAFRGGVEWVSRDCGRPGHDRRRNSKEFKRKILATKKTLLQTALVTDIIAKLSTRFRNENDLSDLIWTLCEVSSPFKQLFLLFFFKDLPEGGVGIQLQREYTRGQSRPDFFFDFKGKEYLIEVKIYDYNDHFEQYKADFPRTERGWIANYATPPHTDFIIKTWREFHTYLENKIHILDPDTQSLVHGFCEYVKSVCTIIKFEKMNLSNLSALYFFNKIIYRVVERPHPEFEIKLHTSPKSHFDSMSGKFFSLRAKDKTYNCYPWFGVYYDASIVCLCIGFGKGWCKIFMMEYMVITIWDQAGCSWKNMRMTITTGLK
jgi:hypothetical protein